MFKCCCERMRSYWPDGDCPIEARGFVAAVNGLNVQ